MHANSTQRPYRFSIFFALTSFIGCGLFSLFYVYKDKQLADRLEALAEGIQELEVRCASKPPSTPPEPICERLHDQHVGLYRNQNAKQAYRNKAVGFLCLALVLPLLSLAVGKWWYWVVTGRFRPKRKRVNKQD